MASALFEAVIAGLYCSGSRSLPLAGEFALAAALCTFLAARSHRLLVLNALALASLGVLQIAFTHYRVSIFTVALLILLMAAPLVRLIPIPGALPVGAALVFLAIAFRLIPMEPGSNTGIVWLGIFFATTAFCKIALALPDRGSATS